MEIHRASEDFENREWVRFLSVNFLRQQVKSLQPPQKFHVPKVAFTLGTVGCREVFWVVADKLALEGDECSWVWQPQNYIQIRPSTLRAVLLAVWNWTSHISTSETLSVE